MTSGRLEVRWHGPYKFFGAKDDSVLTTSLSSQLGIYLWTIPFEDKYLTYYVGETGRSFAIRFMEHARDLLNGLYRIYDPDEFAEGRKTMVWGGMWKPGRKDPGTMLEFLNRYLEMSQFIYRYLGQFRFFLAPINVEKRIRQRIEAAIAKKLHQQTGLVGNFQDSDIRYLPRRAGEQPISVIIKFFEPVLGLSSELKV